MSITKLAHKIINRIWSILIRHTRHLTLYPKLYRSYWHRNYTKPTITPSTINYFTAVPNPGAGIGHQMANWIAGYWFAKQFELQFAHYPFSTKKWEEFLGFGEGEITVKDLLNKGYKKVRLPLFNEFNENEVVSIKKIIGSYVHEKVVFICEQDQFYQDQFGVMNDLKQKFYAAKSRQADKLFYDSSKFNIAIHIRRGDIVAMKENNEANGNVRWLDNNYYVTVLNQILTQIKTNKPIAIYLFSQGEKKDFKEFEQFEKLHYCLDTNPYDTFLHLVKADILISSKSSFSYKPALISNGIKICPKDFWHGYPTSSDFILVENDSTFHLNSLLNTTINVNTKS